MARHYIPPDKGEYDNDLTYLNKVARRLNFPTRFMIVRPREPGSNEVGSEDWTFESLESYIERSLLMNHTLLQVWSEVVKINKNIGSDDVIQTYVRLRLGKGDSYDKLLGIANSYWNEFDPNTYTDTDRYLSADDLMRSHRIWLVQFSEYIKEDIKTSEEIAEMHNTLYEERDNSNFLEMSPVRVDSAEFQFFPLYKGQEVHIRDGLDIFNEVVCDEFIPFVQFNYEGEQYRKIFAGKEVNEIKYRDLKDVSTYNNENSFHIILWSGTDPNLVYSSPSISFIKIIWSLETGSLVLEVPLEGNDWKAMIGAAINKIEKAFRVIRMGDYEEITIGGNFSIYDLRLKEIPFADLVLNANLFSYYLYIEESTEMFALRKKINFHYYTLSFIPGQSASTVDVSVTESDGLVGETIILQLPDGSVGSRILTEETPINKFSFKKCDRRVLNQFINIFRVQVLHYKRWEAQIIRSYLDIIPELEGLSTFAQRRAKSRQKKTSNKSKDSREETLIRQLQAVSKDIFSNNYARICQTVDRQPIIIQPEDVESWTSEVIEFKGTQIKKQVIAFPKDPRPGEKILYIGCQGTVNPFPGVRVNTYENKDRYPFLPCCFNKDQTDPNANSHYNEYYRNIPYKPSNKGKKLKGAKILTINRLGNIPVIATDLLKQYVGKIGEIQRMGVNRSPSSLLHCICSAIDDPNYISLNEQAREDYINRLRRWMASKVDPNLLRQELYDSTPEQIRNQLMDTKLFFDPKLYYRAAEEVFNVNIYVFSSIANETKKEEDASEIEIPRNKFFHARPSRTSRPTIVIYKNFGTESDNLVYPQCELIIDYVNHNNAAVKLFGLQMDVLCRDILFSAQETIYINKQVNGVKTHVNLFSAQDFFGLLRSTPKFQYIDTNGKVRAFVLNTKINGGDLRPIYEDITIIVPPSQPENLPNIESNRLPYAHLDIILALFNDNRNGGKNNSGKPSALGNDGVWFSVIDLAEGIYFPIKEVLNGDVLPEFISQLPRGANNPIVPVATINFIERLQKLKKDLSFITQLVAWLFEIWKLTHVVNSDLNGFIKTYIGIYDDTSDNNNMKQGIVERPQSTNLRLDNRDVSVFSSTSTTGRSTIGVNRPPSKDVVPLETNDSSLIYDFSQLPRQVPAYSSVRSALEYLRNRTKGFIMEGQNGELRVRMYSNDFYERINSYLRRYDASTANLKSEARLVVKDYYKYAGDFNRQPYTNVFVGVRDFNTWLTNDRRKPEIFFEIKDSVTSSLANTMEPYLYEDQDKRLFIIQNVVGKTIDRALTVAKIWRDEERNPGAFVEPHDRLYNYVVYEIGINGILIPSGEERGSPGNQLLLLRYNSLKAPQPEYAAMLPIN